MTCDKTAAVTGICWSRAPPSYQNLRVVRTVIIVLGLLAVNPSVGRAQTITPGTFALSAATGLATNRQTISSTDESGTLQLTNVDFTSIRLGFEATYFVTPRFGIGGLISYQRISVTAPDRNAVAELAGGYVGMLAKVHMPLGDRSSFAFVGSGGGILTKAINQNTGLSDDLSINAYGRYWLAGAELSAEVAPNASFDAGLRYQSSTFTAPGGRSGKATSAGLLVDIGFSVYWR